MQQLYFSHMEIKFSHQNISSTKTQRRYSLIQSPTSKDIFSHRQRLRNKYHQYLLQRQRSHQPEDTSACSEADSSYNEELRMPRIHNLVREREEIGQILRKTINRFNYEKHSNQKKALQLNRKKHKYQKILKIRQSHHIEKMQLSQSRLLLEKNISEEKQAVRKEVLLNKVRTQRSIIKCLSEKKEAGEEQREMETLNESRIVENKRNQYERKNKMYRQMSLEAKQMHEKRVSEEDLKRKRNLERYYTRVEQELEKNKQLNKIVIKNRSRVGPKIINLIKSRQQYEKQIRQLKRFLKEDYSNSRHPISEKKKFFTNSTALAKSDQL